ncbi:hypothetical protein ACFSYH_05970 [Populibacterium corticicola]|uniref:Uncharacterized protein n=1 Tax=Populibacterium corticicola TaxID=1812826 RepID=A0ABW5XG92_9MICO
MSVPDQFESWSAFQSNSFGALSSGDEAYPEFFDESVSRTYYAGTSRRLQSVQEVARAIFLIAVMLVAAIFVMRSVDSRTAPSAAVSTHESAAVTTQVWPSSRLGNLVPIHL